jgi:hypothetical protein
MKCISAVLSGLAVLCFCASAFAADGKNLAPSIAEWTVSGKSAEVVKDGESFCITGTKGCSATMASPAFLEPGKTYVLLLKAKRDGDTSGVVYTGCGLIGRNWYIKNQDEWTTLVNYFTVSSDASVNKKLIIGANDVSGKTTIKNIVVFPVQITNTKDGDIELGYGEALAKGAYTDFHNADWSKEWQGGCIHRTLDVLKTFYSTEFFCGQANNEVIYKESLPFNMNSASVNVVISYYNKDDYYSKGVLELYVSKDKQNWTKIASRNETGNLSAEVPASFFPTKTLYVRLATGTEPTILYFRYYKFSAKVDYSGKDIKGETKLDIQ